MPGKTNFKKGFGVVELVVAVAIITIFMAVIAFGFTSFLKLAFSNVRVSKSAFLAEEAIEAVKFLRDVSWEDNIATLISDASKEYFLNFDGNTWQITEDNVFVEGFFERKFLVEKVFRDADGKIVDSGGGTEDDGTKKITAFVSWKSGSATTTKSVSTYITDI